MSAKLNLQVDREPSPEAMQWLLDITKYGRLLDEASPKRYIVRAIARDVLAVLRVWPEVLDAKVYIGAVPGQSHNREWPEVARHGSKQGKEVAEAIFPEIALYGLTYDRF